MEEGRISSATLRRLTATAVIAVAGCESASRDARAPRQRQQLHNSIESRQVIGEAIGVMRAKANFSSQQARDLLANASQRTDVGMRDLAQQLADGTPTGKEPPTSWPAL